MLWCERLPRAERYVVRGSELAEPWPAPGGDEAAQQSAAAQAVTEAKKTSIPAIVPASLFTNVIDNPLIWSLFQLVLASPAVSLANLKNTPMTG